MKNDSDPRKFMSTSFSPKYKWHSTVLGKMSPGKIHSGKIPPGKLPSGKYPLENCAPSPRNFSVNFFLSLIFISMMIFVRNFSHTMLIIHIYVTNNAGHRYLASEANCRKASLTLWSAIIRPYKSFYSSFKEHCREIVHYSLPARKKPPEKKINNERKMLPDEPPLPENCLQGIKLPLMNFRLYFRPNMIGWTIRPHNLEELLTVRCC